MQDSKVDLPDPFGPITAIFSPASTTKETFFNTGLDSPSKDFEIL